MLIKPFGDVITKKKDPTTMSFLGTVEDNNDPEKLGRVKIRVSPYSELTTEELPWACPVLGSHGNSSSAGGFNIPEVGAQVRVFFPSQDLTAPYYTGAELNVLNRVTLFDENYPNAYGYKDSNGNFIKVDKTAGTTHWQHESTTNVQVTADGSININLRNGASCSITSFNTFNISISGLDITGMPDGSLTINSNSEISVKALNMHFDTPELNVTGGIKAGTGYSGMLWLNNGVATVTNGIITSVEGG